MFTCTYRFRQPLFGSEQTHKGIIDTDGVTLARGGKEYVEAIREIRQLKEQDIQVPDEVKSRTTAYLWNMDNLIDIENHRHHKDFDPWQFNYLYYSNLKSMGAPVVFLQENDQFDSKEYPFMVAPAYQIANMELVNKWSSYVRDGGHLILTLRTAKKDPDGHLWKAKNQEPIWDLIGAEIPEFDHLPSKYPGQVSYKGNHYQWYRWGDWVGPRQGTEVLAKYDDQFYKGTAAAVTRKLGKGSVTYIGVYTNDGEMERKIMRALYLRNEANILDLAPYVFTEWRDGYWISVNYSSNSVNAPVHKNAEIIYGKEALAPGGVTVWKTPDN